MKKTILAIVLSSILPVLAVAEDRKMNKKSIWGWVTTHFLLMIRKWQKKLIKQIKDIQLSNTKNNLVLVFQKIT